MTNNYMDDLETQLLISKRLDKQHIAVLENGQLKEFHPLETSYVGHIYQGKVIRVLSGMEAAFIDIGLEKAAYLPLTNDTFPIYSDVASLTKQGDLSSDLKEGQYILVQIIKDEVAEKGVKVTTQIALTGSHLVMYPLRQTVKISCKINVNLERKRLHTLANNLFDASYGWLFRTSSHKVKEDELVEESSRLQQQWQEILDSRRKKTVSLLYKAENILTQCVLDRPADSLKSIYVDSKETMDSLIASLRTFHPLFLSKVQLYENHQSLFDDFDVKNSLDKALQKKIQLPSGGSLVCESTEAMTVIDVNTGSYVGKNSLQETIYQTNLEAAIEIAHQIRLRNISGMIVIDFINMENSKQQVQIRKKLLDECKYDSAKIYIGKFSPLGLVEMTRSNKGFCLAEQFKQTCPVCLGDGAVGHYQVMKQNIIDEIMTSHHAQGITAFDVYCSTLFFDELCSELQEEVNQLLPHKKIKICLEIDQRLKKASYNLVTLS